MNDGRAALRLHCRGVVQGVGFRPAVCRLADSLGLDGTLTNVNAGVRLELAGSRAALQTFLRLLPGSLPPRARLEPLQARWLRPPLPPQLARGQGLRIGVAAPTPLGQGWLAPSLVADLAPCRHCLAELGDPTDRRHGYAFLSCSQCGPRYSIATAEPYARAHTTMAAFPLCRSCRLEFEDPGDRRFHAEAIACPACGPRLLLQLATPAFRPCPLADPLQRAAALLRAGGILALQGVGGFQLLALAGDPSALARLRRRKVRPGKPFALLLDDPDRLAPWLEMAAAERRALAHPAAAIVLLQRRPEAGDPLPGVATGSPCLGVMLPASPLHHLLLQAVGAPLVCTSGNRSGEPLCIDPAEALERLAGIADGVLHHDRAIARPLEDSLLQVVRGEPMLLRRARGFAPEPLPLPGDGPLPAVLALAGDLKSAPALARGDRLWLAPHQGDLADARVQRRWRAGCQELLARVPPSGMLACDAHPGYLSQQWAIGQGRSVRTVPHHLAHGLAVVAEHGLAPPLLLVAFDGLGYAPPWDPAAVGTGRIEPVAGETGMGERGWARGSSDPDRCEPIPDAPPLLRGGEVLLLEAAPDGRWRAAPLASLLPFPLPGGERAMVEPRRCALGLLERCAVIEHPGGWRVRRAFAGGDLALLRAALASGCHCPQTTSAGRLFDGAAALLGLVQVLRHEGQGGLRLQAAARRGLERAGSPWPDALPLLDRPGREGHWLDWRPLLLGLLAEAVPGADRQRAAARFHLALAEGLAGSLAALLQDRALPGAGERLVLSGGCFQNRLLLEACLAALERRGLGARWSQAVPCNDGGLALGQITAVRRLIAAGRRR